MADAQAGPILTALNYLFSHDNGKTIAHCLDLDLVTSGGNLAEAEESLNALVLYQISSCYTGGNWTQLKFKAPIQYWQQLEGANRLETVHLEVEIPPVVLPIMRNRISLPVVRSERLRIAA